ncbi:hypothetical protein BACCAP_01904 [Pseudoflavonifractor capillosus ATCC 29799]|uniref:Uncharacterized protein n=1 Tax=Pseudoflavonifractor capillosus ATCC 29799 TaxID=411467 RepID=A6NUM2_9FIRM|nr:hypothetical protein BACCAP_01904 [Pseudoflavonifractor capillosus ATCC 29799]
MSVYEKRARGSCREPFSIGLRKKPILTRQATVAIVVIPLQPGRLSNHFDHKLLAPSFSKKVLN